MKWKQGVANNAVMCDLNSLTMTVKEGPDGKINEKRVNGKTRGFYLTMLKCG